MQSELDAFNASNENVETFIALVRRYTNFEELTPAVLNEFVDKVIVHEPVWSEATETQKRKGIRSQQVEVYLKYIGNFDVPDTRTPEQIEADRIAEEKLAARRTYFRGKTREFVAKKRAAIVAGKAESAVS